MSANRPHLIGATDAATLIGIGTESQAHLFLRLRGLVVEEDSDEDALMAGRLAEDGVLKPLIEHRFGAELLRVPPATLPSDPRIGCSPDFICNRTGWLYETKFTGSRAMWGTPGSREVPPLYYCQCQFQLAVRRESGACDGGVWLAPCFIPGFDIQRYPIEEDREIGSRMLQAARDMLHRVDNDIPPDPHNEADARALLLASRGELHVLTPFDIEALKRIRALQETAKHCEREAKELRDGLIPSFGTATELVSETGEVIATWRANREFDLQALRDAHPDIVDVYLTPQIDVSRLKRDHKKLCEQFMREPSEASSQTRSLRIKEV